MAYYDKMKRYSGLGQEPGWLDWLFRPAVAVAMQYGVELKKAEEAKAAAQAAIAQQGTSPDLEARLAAAEAEIARLKAQQPQQPQQAAGINWLGLGALGLGAYFVFFRAPSPRPRSRRR